MVSTAPRGEDKPQSRCGAHFGQCGHDPSQLPAGRRNQTLIDIPMAVFYTLR